MKTSISNVNKIIYFFCKNNNFLGIFKEKTKALWYQHGMRHFLVID
jgi:hypothetical protein